MLIYDSSGSKSPFESTVGYKNVNNRKSSTIRAGASKRDGQQLQPSRKPNKLNNSRKKKKQTTKKRLNPKNVQFLKSLGFRIAKKKH